MSMVPILVTSPNQKKKKRKEKKTSPICVIYILTGTWSVSQWPAFQIEMSPSLLAPLLEAVSCGELHCNILMTLF